MSTALAPLTNEGNPLTEIRYLNPRAITDVRMSSDRPWKGRTVSGYGGQIPTDYLITLNDGRTRRVLAMQYGNAASLYVRVGGKVAHLDTWAEGYLEDLRDGKPFATAEIPEEN